jgi:hypothetical protein
MTALEDVRIGAGFLWKLPSFLRHPIALQEAQAALRRRLAHREADFLTVARSAIYPHAGGPYRRLLDLAGCEYGDLERLVRQDGVEGALRTLYRQGVYLTVDEFKGRLPVVRGSATIAVDPLRLQNPTARVHVPARSSASRGPGTPAGVDLAFVRDLAVNHCLFLHARGGAAWRHAIWSVPGSSALKRLLWLAGFGATPVRWFSQVDAAAPGLHPRYRWSGHGMRWAGLLAGVPLPQPVHVPLDDPLPIAHWMSGVLRAGGTPHLSTFASAAVRLCEAARAADIDLHGAQLTMSGEPITAARLAAVLRTGVEAVPQYGASEGSGTVGHGCLAPAAADDLHLFHDLRAVIQPAGDRAGPCLPPNTLLFSSLRPTAPLILLNVSLGDQAVLEQRACGCPLERLGWTTHLRTIRSYEKLTAGGVRLFDTDLIRVLDEVLPARLGGGPTDYQLVEEETENGHPRLRLLVHPAVGPLDPAALADAFLTAIGRGSGVERVVGLLWRDAGFLRVERRPPEATPGGKILHLHLERRLPPGRAGKDGEGEGRKA